MLRENVTHFKIMNIFSVSDKNILVQYIITLVFTYSFYNLFSRVSFCYSTPQTHSPVLRSQVGVQGRSNNYVRQELCLLHHCFP